tara:strand:+ start:21 stop:245 length:225 start_codon:yes stop_codon:yes gene_type:complete
VTDPIVVKTVSNEIESVEKSNFALLSSINSSSFLHEKINKVRKKRRNSLLNVMGANITLQTLKVLNIAVLIPII